LPGSKPRKDVFIFNPFRTCNFNVFHNIR
jgi:hypothetical protein